MIPGETPDPEQIAPSGERLVRLAWWLYLAMAVAGLVWMGLRDGGLPWETFVDLSTPAGPWLDLAWGVGGGLALLAFWQVGRRLSKRARELEETLGALLSGITPADAVVLALISGIGEELFFRGALQGTIGLLWATVLFALVHTGPGPAFRLWTLFAAVAGLVLGLLVVHRGTLLPAIVGHALVNGVNLWRLARRDLADTKT